MKKATLLIVVSYFVLNKSRSQITKDYWMVGGNANFSFNSASAGSTVTKTTTVNLTPNIGYFFIDKFAGGIRFSFYNNDIKFGSPNSNSTRFTTYGIGPYIRYYFLSVDKPYNILSEISYQFDKEKIETNSSSSSNNNSNSFSLSFGSVIYFNTSVGLEFLLNYTSSGNNANSNSNNANIEPNVAPAGCSCSGESDWCTYASICRGKGCTSTTSGCGTWWNYACDGKCIANIWH